MRIQFDSEKELEDFIFSQMKDGGLCPVDDEEWDYYFRQPDFLSYGRGDILKARMDYCPEGSGKLIGIRFCVLEIKKSNTDERTVSQVLRYKQAIERHFSGVDFKVTVDCEIAAPSYKDDDYPYLLNHINEIGITAYEMCFLPTGIKFNIISDDFENISKPPFLCPDIESRIMSSFYRAKKADFNLIQGGKSAT